MINMNEQWVVAYETPRITHYVSNTGKIKKVKSTGKELPVKYHRSFRNVVVLTTGKHSGLADMVAKYFVPKPNDLINKYTAIGFHDGNSNNCAADNLYWYECMR